MSWYADGRNHSDGIENFWNQAKCILPKYKGIPAKQFYLFLQESEFRFDYGPHRHMNTCDFMS